MFAQFVHINIRQKPDKRGFSAGRNNETHGLFLSVSVYPAGATTDSNFAVTDGMPGKISRLSQMNGL
jgi:dihydroorotase